jgi:hypothetical protein
MAKVDDLIKRWAKQIVLTIVTRLAHSLLSDIFACDMQRLLVDGQNSYYVRVGPSDQLGALCW